MQNLNDPPILSAKTIRLDYSVLVGSITSSWIIFWIFFAANCLVLRLRGTEDYEADVYLRVQFDPMPCRIGAVEVSVSYVLNF